MDRISLLDCSLFGTRDWAIRRHAVLDPVSIAIDRVANASDATVHAYSGSQPDNGEGATTDSPTFSDRATSSLDQAAHTTYSIACYVAAIFNASFHVPRRSLLHPVSDERHGALQECFSAHVWQEEVELALIHFSDAARLEFSLSRPSHFTRRLLETVSAHDVVA